MAKATPIAGSELMVFINKKAVALATSHSINLTKDTSESASKDDGKWRSYTPTKRGFEITVEALVSTDEDANSFDALFDLWEQDQPVEIISGRPSNISDDGVPTEGWTAPTTNYYKGMVHITNLSKNDPNAENSSFSATLLGTSKLERVKG